MILTERSAIFEKVVDSCNYILKNDPVAKTAREYLNSRLPVKWQNKYKIGYFPKNNGLKYLTSLVDTSLLKEVNLVYDRYINNNVTLVGHFSEHNIIMPFKDVHGNIISILGRTLLTSEEQKENKIQKYKYTINADKDLYVYGLDTAIDSILEKNCVICVEGQFDFISCKMAGINNVVALGWARLSKYQLFQLLKYTENIILMLDNDEAGVKGKKMAKKKFSNFANIKTASIPEPYKDMDEFLKNSDKRDILINRLNNIKF